MRHQGAIIIPHPALRAGLHGAVAAKCFSPPARRHARKSCRGALPLVLSWLVLCASLGFGQTVISNPGNMSSLSGTVGATFHIQITGASSGSVYGTDVYTDDSSVARAAVHCGMVAVGQSKIVLATILAGQSSYTGSTRNGVTTSSYSSWPKSYSISNPAPLITGQPQSQTVVASSNATFSVTATGSAPLRYQWWKDGLNLSGATNTTLALTNVQPVNIGNYTVVVTNAAGSVTSSVASLTIPGVPTGIWQNLVAYYPFNGNANDASGNGNHGGVNGASLATDRFGMASQAYYFDGTSNYIEIPASTNTFGSTNYTVAMWFNRVFGELSG